MSFVHNLFCMHTSQISANLRLTVDELLSLLLTRPGYFHLANQTIAKNVNKFIERDPFKILSFEQSLNSSFVSSCSKTKQTFTEKTSWIPTFSINTRKVTLFLTLTGRKILMLRTSIFSAFFVKFEALAWYPCWCILNGYKYRAFVVFLLILLKLCTSYKVWSSMNSLSAFVLLDQVIG